MTAFEAHIDEAGALVLRIPAITERVMSVRGRLGQHPPRFGVELNEGEYMQLAAVFAAEQKAAGQ